MLTAYYASLFGVFAFFAVWESGSPRLPFPDRTARWLHVARNAGLFAILMVVANVLLQWALPGFVPALFAAPEGPFARSGLALPVQVAIGVILLDLYEYGWHRLCHRTPWLWRLHQVHHAEAHLDASTCFRFHPLELTLSLLLKLLLLTAAGLPLWVEAVRILFNNPLALAQHANVRFPDWLERRGAWLIITPDAHRVHHSVDVRDYDTNFGEFLSWWDRLFGTYRAPPAAAAEVGLPGFAAARWHTLPGMLAMPWRTRPLMPQT